jgi:hypothetical protein
MAYTKWKPIQRTVCERVGKEAALEVRLVYPSDFMPDQPPRVLGHRCSHGLECNQLDKPTCCWAGTLPDYDPFA